MNPYKQLDIKTIKELLIGEHNGFSEMHDSVRGISLSFSKHFNLSSELHGYLIENFRTLMREYNIPEQEPGFVTHYVDFGQMNHHILEQELRAKQIELFALFYKLL